MMMRTLTAGIFGLALITSAVAEPASAFTPPTVAEIRLDASQQIAFEARRNKEVRASSAHASKFKLVPGLKDPNLISFEAIGLTGCYLRHQRFVFFLHEKPKVTSVLFDADASFRLVHPGDNKVRFEASNYKGMFLAARSDGSVILAKDPPPEESTFFLRKTTE